MSAPEPIPARPRHLSLEAAARIGAKLAEKLHKAGHISERQLEDASRDIALEGRCFKDGYQLAKSLDDARGWDCNLDMAVILDHFADEAEAEIKAAQHAWAEQHGIMPPFPVDARVVARWGGRDVVGTIYRIAGYSVASYLVTPDDLSITTAGGSMVVPFEDVRALGVEATAS